MQYCFYLIGCNRSRNHAFPVPRTPPSMTRQVPDHGVRRPEHAHRIRVWPKRNAVCPHVSLVWILSGHRLRLLTHAQLSLMTAHPPFDILSSHHHIQTFGLVRESSPDSLIHTFNPAEPYVSNPTWHVIPIRPTKSLGMASLGQSETLLFATPSVGSAEDYVTPTVKTF